ncbi:MAG: hypothetical protein QOF38_244, partial [Pseudonocardiales bacterium]|nr:hypothetical protein [Pseudonocardiales bacterium]
MHKVLGRTRCQLGELAVHRQRDSVDLPMVVVQKTNVSNEAADVTGDDLISIILTIAPDLTAALPA